MSIDEAWVRAFSGAFNRHGIGQRGRRRTLSMGVVKEDDGDLDAALAYHRERVAGECAATSMMTGVAQAMARRADALILRAYQGE